MGENSTLKDNAKPCRRRIALVGPVFPYRGGIAQHTTMMARALQDVAELLVVSYRRQYPEFLYPGNSDRDSAAPNAGIGKLQYLIDSINPFTWRAAIQEIRRHKPETVIFVWWTFFWAPCVWFMARRLRKDGFRIQMFCHNAVEHDGAAWKAWLSRRALAIADSYFVHTNEDEKNLRQDFPNAVIGRHAHPIYDHFPEPTENLPRRAKTELLFFGLVRPYKGLDVLIEAMGLLQDEDVMLSVVGEFWSGREEIDNRIKALGLADRVVIVDRYVSDDEAANHFSRADIVVLPYISATGSGVIPLAYHYNKPVIATNVGGLPDVVEDGKTGWLVAPSSSEQLAAAISTKTNEPSAATVDAIGAIKQSLTWENMTEALVNEGRGGVSRARCGADNE